MDGVFLSPTEDEFVGRIAEELEHFLAQGQHQRVLLFPPLSSRLRYLIHRTVENMDLLSSFSVGEGWRRRTVICHSAVRLPSDTASDQKPNPLAPSVRHSPGAGGAAGSGHATPGDIHGDSSRASVGSGRITRPARRKPDKALYVPKGSRKKSNWRERESPGEDVAPGGDNDQKNSIGDTPREGSGKQQELGEGNAPGEGSAERRPCDGNVPSLGNSGDPREQENRDRDCPLSSGHDQHLSDEAEERGSGRANTLIQEGSEFQGRAREENQPSHDAGGSERGESSFPSENRGGSWTEAVLEPPGAAARSLESSRNKSPPADQDSGNAEPRQGFSRVESHEQESPSGAQEERKHLQNLEEGPAEALAAPELLHGGDPSAPEAVPCGGKEPTEEDKDKEHSDVAEALGRGLDLAAGDREGTRQSDLEDDCTAELLAEIVGNLTVKDISIERISVDYSPYGEAQLSEGDLGHVTEIYDFPSALKTEDLMEIFADFHESGFKIQWVDDTHALGIFSSLSTASQALGRRYPCLKLRPLIHATKQSKVKALQRPKLLQLGKERPQTDTAVARRLVSHALGWRQRQHESSGGEAVLPEALEQQE